MKLTNLKSNKQGKGFALFTGLVLLLVLTLLSIVVMRGTKLELAMTTAATGSEQANSLADSARATMQEALLQAAEEIARIKGGSTGAEFQRDGNQAIFMSAPPACGFTSVPANFARSPVPGRSGEWQVYAFNFNTDEANLRIQTINAVIPHIRPRAVTSPTTDCKSGQMGVAAVLLGSVRETGQDVSNSGGNSTSVMVTFVGFGTSIYENFSKALSTAQIQVERR